MPVEVPCPGCGLKLKAPDNMVGKRAKCKKCETTFRIPGGSGEPGESVGDAQMLSVISMPSPFGPGGNAQTPIAAAAPATIPPGVGSSTPAAPRPGIASKPAMPGLPATPPGVAARPPSTRLPKPAAPAAETASPAAAALPKSTPLPKAPSLPKSTPLAKPALPTPPPPEEVPLASAVPEAFALEEEEPKAKSKKRDREDEDEPRSKRKSRDDDDDEDDRSRSKKKSRDDDDDDDRPRSKKKSRDDDDDDDDDDDRPRSKKKSRDDDDDDDDDRPRSKKKSRDDDDDDRPRSKKKSRDDDDDDDRPRSKKKSRDDDDDDDDDRPRSKKKNRDDDDDEDDRPRSKKRSRDDDDDDDDDDDRPRKKKSREEDDAPVPKPVEPRTDVIFAFNSAPASSGPSSDVVSAPAAGSGDPFAFDAGPAAAPAPTPEAKSNKRDDDEKPKSKRKDDDDDDRRKPKRKDDDEKPKSKRKDDEPAAPAASGDPFSFDAGAAPEVKSKEKDQEKTKEKDKGKKRDDDSGKKDEAPSERKYVSAKDQKGGKKMLLYAGVGGVLALGTLIAALVMMQKAKKEQEREEAAALAAKAAKEKKDDPPPAADPKKDPPKKDPPKKDPNPKDPTPKDPTPPTKEDPPPPSLELDPKVKSLSFATPAAAPTISLKPKGTPISIETPPAKLKRVFAPEKRNLQDVVAVWQANPGAGGKGEKLVADIHSGSSGAKVARIDFDGDGKDVKCDVSPDGKSFVAVGPDGKLTMWNLGDAAPMKPKLLDGVDPLADRADLKAFGLAAVFFNKDPNRLVIATTAGSVHLFNTLTKKIVEGWTPPVKLTAGKVVLGKNIATADDRTSIVIAIGTTITQLESGTLKTAGKTELGGEVARSLGIAVLGVPGRIVYAFETAKKEKAVMFGIIGAAPTTFRWSDAAGDPLSATWLGASYALVAAEKGVVYFTAKDGKFQPLAFAELPGKMLHDGNEDGHWFVTPDPIAPLKAAFQQLGGDDLQEFLLKAGEGGKEAPTARLSNMGLAK